MLELKYYTLGHINSTGLNCIDMILEGYIMKKCLFVVFAVLSFAFVSCSNITDNHGSSLTVTIDGSDFARSSSRNVTINPDFSDYYFVVNVLGDYEDTKVITFTDVGNYTVTFDSIPIGKKIYLKANAYKMDATYGSRWVVQSCHCFTGTSAIQRMYRGGNTVELEMKYLLPDGGYYSYSFGGNYFDDLNNISYDCSFYDTGKYIIRLGQDTMVSEGLWSGNLEVGETIVMEEYVYRNGDSYTILETPNVNNILVEPLEAYGYVAYLLSFTSKSGITFNLGVN